MQEYRLAFHPSKQEAGMVRQALLRMPGEFGAGDPVEDAFDQTIAERDEMSRVLGQIPTRYAHGLGEPDDARDVFGPGSTVALVPTTVQLRLQPHAGAHDQAADALRTMELVRGH